MLAFVCQTGLSVGGQISVSLQIAYNAWLAAQTHARGMGVAMKNNNEAAAFNVKDYDMVVNEECWIKGTCPNYVRVQSRSLFVIYGFQGRQIPSLYDLHAL